MTIHGTKKGLFYFFNTKTGHKVAFWAASCTTLGLFAGNFLPETIFLSKYREFMTCYRNGIERKISNKVLQRLEKAFDKLELTSYERKLIKPFSVFGFDVSEAGSLKYRFGCALGIPANYEYDSAKDIERSSVQFRNEPIKWDSDSGKLLQESIILSEDEQIFGLCKAILQMQSYRILLNSIFPSASFLTVYTIGSLLNERLNLFSRPLSVRMVMYTILALFGTGLWAFSKDFTQVKMDTDIDKKLVELGPEFIDAGINYYDKILKKNLALRELIGNDMYTAKGNENYYLRQKSLPLTIRKSYYEMKLNESNKQPNKMEL